MEKQSKQKIKTNSQAHPFAFKTIWTLSKASKKLTSAAKGKKVKANKGEYLAQTFMLQGSSYLSLASWWISLDDITVMFAYSLV